jgi:hypothetical protein
MHISQHVLVDHYWKTDVDVQRSSQMSTSFGAGHEAMSKLPGRQAERDWALAQPIQPVLGCSCKEVTLESWNFDPGP